MTVFSDFRALETPLRGAEPLFPVEAPDRRRDWPEADRQATLFGKLRMQAPSLCNSYPIPNAGKRAPHLAIKECIKPGVFDINIVSGPVGPRLAAWIELKGYDRSGRPGVLKANQISWGNAMYRSGWPVACFFSPDSAVAWLRTVFPQAFVISDLMGEVG